MSRLPALVIAPVLLAACQNVPSPPDLEPLEEPRALEAAPPRVSGAIPIDRSRERAFTTQGVAETPAIAPPPTAGAAGQAGDVTLNFVDTDIREIARTILGTTLKLNYTIDPNVHGTGSIDTGTPLPRSALLPTLETLLNANGATLVERNGVYAVVPIAAGNTTTAGARFPDTRARGARENTGLDPFGEIAGAWGGDFHSSFAGRNPPPHAREGSHSCFRSDGKPPR
jgi:general secretion pathway protein D